MRHYGYRQRTRKSTFKESTLHVPSTISGTVAANNAALIVIQSPSIDAGGSASDNIEASDRDRTVNVGHSLGKVFVNLAIRATTGTGIISIGVMRVERATAVPAIGVGNVPSLAEIAGQGMQQAQRMQNPGRVVRYLNMAYTAEFSRIIKFSFVPAKYKMAKVRPGDYFIMQVFNKGPTGVTYDYEARFKELS